MKKILIFIFTCILINSQYSQVNSSIIEITATDITLYPWLKSNQISVFGIHTGMTQAEVNKILSENSQLYHNIDERHRTTDYRIYVYDKSIDNKKNNCILYLIWTDNSTNLNEIIFYTDFESYLVGSTSKLLTFEAFDIQSNFSKEYLGYPNKTEVTLDIPSIGLKQTTNYFYSKEIQIMFNESRQSNTTNFGFFMTE